MRRYGGCLLFAVAVGPVLSIACGGSASSKGASFNATSNANPVAPPPTSSAAPLAPTAGPLGSVFTTDPNALASLLAAAAAAGSAWLGPAAAVADPAEAGLRAAAAQYAPGMTAEGQVAKATLSEGGHAELIANMDPTKCYAIVAYGAGVADLDVNLLAPPFYNLLAGQDGMAGPTAVIGGAPRPMCPLLPIAIAYKVDLYAKKGGGLVAAQVYSKPK